MSILIENLVDPTDPQISSHLQEGIHFKNCLFHDDPLLICEYAPKIYFESCIFNKALILNYEYKSRIHFESCIFRERLAFTGATFFNGFIIEKSIFNNTNASPKTGYILIDSLSGNDKTIEIKGNIFYNFVYFEDNFPNAPIIVEKNLFLDDTNLLEKAHLSLDVRDIDSIKDNYGLLNINYDLKIKSID
jgi:hypothetical protein